MTSWATSCAFFTVSNSLSRIPKHLHLHYVHNSLGRDRSARSLICRTLNNKPSSAQITVPDQPCWMLFRNIETACVLEGGCARRDCDRKCTARCVACKKAGYCGVY